MATVTAKAVLSSEHPEIPFLEDRDLSNRFFHQCMAALTVALLAFAFLCLKLFGYALSFNHLALVFAQLLPCLLLACLGWWREKRRMLEIGLLFFWAVLMNTLLKFPIYLAARSPLALRDATLARLDHALGIGLPSILALISRHPRLGHAVGACYDFLVPFMLIAGTLPVLLSRFRAMKEYLLSSCIALMAGAILFAFLPVAGPWTVFHFTPSREQLLCQNLLLQFRSHAFRKLTFGDAAIIGFPSFHVIFAILSAVALGSIKPLRIPAAVLAGLISISTLTTGWHYVSDVFAGVLVAAMSIAAAKGWSHLENRRECACAAGSAYLAKQQRSLRRALPLTSVWQGFPSKREGQSLLEVAIFLPIFTLLVCYAVDCGYLFIACATLDTAAQNAADYAIQGTKSPAQTAEPAASSVAALAIASIGLSNASTLTSVQVCSNSVGTPSVENIAQCQAFGADESISYTPDTDPESPTFQLNRVDVVYTISSPIPLPSALTPVLSVHRYVEMRAIQ